MPFYKFEDEDGNQYGSFEAFQISGAAADLHTGLSVGWYWWSCFPGCVPESDPYGPFESEQEAIDDALG